MPGRAIPLVTGEYYHLFNRGSDKREVFLQPRDYTRFLQTLNYYQFQDTKPKFSHRFNYKLKSLKLSLDNKLVNFICYCLMPNHFHLLVQQLKEKGISIFVSQLLNSYTKYFNTKYKRVGHLFQSTFKSVRIENEEQLLHVSRYIHLNPIVSEITEDLDNYPWSSYHEYVRGPKICSTEEILRSFSSKEVYKQFLDDQIDYGKSLEQIKHQIIE